MQHLLHERKWKKLEMECFLYEKLAFRKLHVYNISIDKKHLCKRG